MVGKAFIVVKFSRRMSFRYLIGYENVFADEPIDLKENIRKLPMTETLVVLSFINTLLFSRCTDESILRSLLRRIDSDTFNNLNQSIWRSVPNKVSILFSNITTTILAGKLIEFGEENNRELEPKDDLLIFKLLLVIQSNYTHKQDILLSKIGNTPTRFNYLTWSVLLDQMQFNIRANIPLETLKALVIYKYLKNDKVLTKYLLRYEQIKQTKVNQLINNLIYLITEVTVKNSTNLNYNQFVYELSRDQLGIIESLILNIDEVKKNNRNFKNHLALKRFPFIKFNENNIAIFSRDFATMRLYLGFLFDFYYSSGVTKEYKSFDILKTEIGDVFEKKLFRPLIKTLFNKSFHKIQFPGKEYSFDAYVRIYNSIYLIEFKDNLLKEEIVTQADAESFEENIKSRFIIDKGRAKGVGQLLNSICKLSKGPFDFDDFRHDNIKVEKLKIYPVLVYTDIHYSMAGINQFINEEVKGRLDKVRVPFKRVGDPTLISLNYLVDNGHKLLNGKLGVAISKYHKFIQKNRDQLFFVKNQSLQNYISTLYSIEDVKLNSGNSISWNEFYKKLLSQMDLLEYNVET